MEILNLFSGESLLLIYVIVIATFVGIEVINNIPTVLHTPLMSGSNAISGIVIIGATIDVLKAAPDDYFSLILGFFAIALASINVFGGFLVTDRILGMFKKKK
ncbi:MAG: NAD(P) transhydrogenase subunit alpha [Bacteroidetes bacterium]|jgi:NAD(P) transhydrogenase subunit alpha|nr:NAD(P) transhydrogenase subunit alpha [Bacteroidota bacterium]MBP7256085.1 NAD(P) transhydrogenase subunit alpha [Chitinophagales bacterium]MBK7139080.1 NAD(P) transhydrogenase subunit alpha [Bacteroidota bacterium]MBK7506233.1 NAD(P) transhydrogenase subunit alpha [Bacteroidota bacterium]MBK7639682.1 NAD(P) transhydrogenase subunit alpha [Bacteroidota bacterium]